FRDKLSRRTIVGRTGEPEDLAGALLLLSSRAGAYITGQNLVVDGGWTAL
ncbi:MAG: SDR family oxidoreductase, partial [Spirochaetota bacterium]